MSDTGRQSPPSPSDCNRRRRREFRLAGACLVWAVCFAGSRQLIRHNQVPAGAIRWLVAALPTVAGAVLLFAYMRFLRELDELQRDIQLRALALGFGGGFLAICGYVSFEPLGAPPFGAIDLLAIMPVLYAIAGVIGSRRYR